jgi:hypothetical protein
MNGLDLENFEQSDEFGVKLISFQEFMWARKGATIVEDAAYSDKRQFTANLHINALGGAPRLDVIYGGTSEQCLPTDEIIKHAQAHGLLGEMLLGCS